MQRLVGDDGTEQRGNEHLGVFSASGTESQLGAALLCTKTRRRTLEELQGRHVHDMGRLHRRQECDPGPAMAARGTHRPR